jgi:hypothetical protein
MGQRLVKLKMTNMNLQEQINRIHEMMGVVSEMRFFQRRVNLNKVKKILEIHAEQVFGETESYGQFKYELTLKAVEDVIYQDHGLGWEDLPEQDEIDYVNTLADLYNDEIKRLYNMLAFKDMDVISEEMSIATRRRIKFGDIDKIINTVKIKSFKKNEPVENSLKDVIRLLVYALMPDDFDEDDEEYYKVWDEIKEYINNKYGDELRRYFETRQMDTDQEKEDIKYIFVKHDKPYYDNNWKGFADTFDSFNDLITRYGDWVDVDWDDVKRKLDTINNYPEDTFTGSMNSRPLRISSIGDQGNDWGYNFSIVKKIKKEQSKKKTQEMKEGEITERCWKGYTQKGMKTMFGKRYPNCVKKTKK